MHSCLVCHHLAAPFLTYTLMITNGVRRYLTGVIDYLDSTVVNLL